MFCVHCGKAIVVEDTKFCSYCGKPIGQDKPSLADIPLEWEYSFYRRYWEEGNRGRWNLTFGRTEYDVRMDKWVRDQNEFLTDIQKLIGDGWETINTPGPSSYHFVKHTYEITWLAVYSFVVDLRRPARPRTEKEKQLIGIWQEAKDPNKGFWNVLGNIISEQKLTTNRLRCEFCKDRTFQEIDQYGEKSHRGIFFENNSGEIQLLYRNAPDHDKTLSVMGDKYTEHYDNPRNFLKSFEMERVS